MKLDLHIDINLFSGILVFYTYYFLCNSIKMYYILSLSAIPFLNAEILNVSCGNPLTYHLISHSYKWHSNSCPCIL